MVAKVLKVLCRPPYWQGMITCYASAMVRSWTGLRGCCVACWRKGRHTFAPVGVMTWRRGTISLTKRQRLEEEANELGTNGRGLWRQSMRGSALRHQQLGVFHTFISVVASVGVAVASSVGLMLFWVSSAAADNDAAFTIGNYPVEAQAENAVAAKKKALKEGRDAAFRSLLKRLVPVTAYSRIARIKQTDATAFVDGVSVRSERNSATEYIASMDFSFRAEEVRNLLRRQGVPFIEEQAPTSVIVPIVREGANASTRTDPQWIKTWQSLDLKNALSPLRIEPLKPVVHVDTIRMALGADSNAERILATEYQSERVMLLLADVDKKAKKINVTVVGRDGVGPIHWTRSYRLVDGDVSYTLELVAVVTLGVLEGRWKALKVEARGGVAALSSPTRDVSLQVTFSGLHEWNIIRRKLLETPGVEDVTINAVSARSANVVLSYPGGGGSLAAVLLAQGLNLMQSGNVWLLAMRY